MTNCHGDRHPFLFRSIWTSETARLCRAFCSKTSPRLPFGCLHIVPHVSPLTILIDRPGHLLTLSSTPIARVRQKHLASGRQERRLPRKIIGITAIAMTCEIGRTGHYSKPSRPVNETVKKL